MKKRCRNENDPNYKNYGGRGISVDPRWDDFWNFVNDMGPKPEGAVKYSIDRIDNNGNYTKSNCRLATYREQAINKRNTIRVMINGIEKPLLGFLDRSSPKIPA